MKTCVYLAVLLISMCSTAPQFGGFFNNIFGGRRRPQPNFRRPNGVRGGGGGRCGGGNQPNHNFGGQDFLISWRIGCTSFSADEGAAFCRNNGMRPISIDNSGKEQEFLRLVARENQKYFWTGGKVSGRNINWPSGRGYNNVNWSNTGGAGRPQPDNREGNEFCVAVLNNFYRDGVRFHDVSCHHRKPIICEA